MPIGLGGCKKKIYKYKSSVLQGYTQWQNMKQMVRDRKNMFLFICTLKNQIIKR